MVGDGGLPMSFKALITHVVSDRGCASRLAMTRSVARALGAEVIGVGAQAPWPYGEVQDARGGEFKRLVAAARGRIAQAETEFRGSMAGHGVGHSWRGEVGHPDVVVTRHARAADLMPTTETPFAADSILLAWKNTRETRRAVSLALPLLQSARRVVVAAVCRAGDLEAVEQELADLSDRLSRHGVKATSLAEVGAPDAAGRRLLRIADSSHSELIVAGAYGHSRLREWVLGGVTRDLIASGRRWVLLSH
jgi:nucleotide-binding universal stress UspA family protein